MQSLRFDASAKRISEARQHAALGETAGAKRSSGRLWEQPLASSTGCQNRRHCMWRNVLIVTVAAAGLSIAAANNADAQRMGIGAQGSTNVGANVGVNAASRRAIVGTRAGLTARAQARGPALRPPGWSHGRKTGWHCRVGARGCIPPGLR